MNKHQGLFITLEGIEGAGKSTHADYIRRLLANDDTDVVLTREPGGTELGERIRDILLIHQELHIEPEAELLLMFTARLQHLKQVIIPGLESGKIVLCDRFTDSSYAYQGGGRGVSRDMIDKLVNIVHPDLKPDLTILLDLSAETGLARARQSGVVDRFESETLKFFESARQTFLDIARAEPDRVFVINAEQDIGNIQQEIKQVLEGKGLC